MSLLKCRNVFSNGAYSFTIPGDVDTLKALASKKVFFEGEVGYLKNINKSLKISNKTTKNKAKITNGHRATIFFREGKDDGRSTYVTLVTAKTVKELNDHFKKAKKIVIDGVTYKYATITRMSKLSS